MRSPSLAVASILALGLLVGAPAPALAGVYVGLQKDLIDPSKGEQPAVALGFDENPLAVLGQGAPRDVLLFLHGRRLGERRSCRCCCCCS